MTSSKSVRRTALICALALGTLTAFYRAKMAGTGQPLVFGGIGFEPGFLYAAVAVCVAAIALTALAVPPHKAGSEPAGLAYKLAIFAAGLGFAAAAVLGLLLDRGGIIGIIESAFMLVCGLALLARASMSESRHGPGLMSLFPVYFLCFFLLKFYRANAGNPSVQSYLFELLAIVPAVLAAYSISSARFEKMQGRRHMFLCLSAAYFAAVEAVSLALDSRLVLTVPGIGLGSAVMLLSVGIYVCAGLFIPPHAPEIIKKTPPEPPKTDDLPPEDEPLTAEKILADELAARLAEEEK